jgi:hypothetical protein
LRHEDIKYFTVEIIRGAFVIRLVALQAGQQRTGTETAPKGKTIGQQKIHVSSTLTVLNKRQARRC